MVLLPTNKAADVIVNKILEVSVDDSPDGWLVRFGSSADFDINERGLVYDANSFEYLLYSQCVLVTTIHRFPYESIITGDGEFGEIKEKYVIYLGIS